MDFSQFDTRAAADKGSWMQLRDPVTNELLADPTVDADIDGRCMVLVYGLESERIQKALLEISKSGMSAEEEDADARITMTELHKKNANESWPLVGGFKNINKDGAPLAANQKDILWFLNLQTKLPAADAKVKGKVFLDQIVDHAADRGQHLGND